jgi:DNA recombination protein RmuC
MPDWTVLQAAVILLAVIVVLLVLVLARQSRGAPEVALLQPQMVELRERLERLAAAQQAVPVALAEGGAAQARGLADVRERLAQLAESARRLEAVGTRVAAVEELLKVPRLRGTLGELWLEELLRQVFPSGKYHMQHGFRSGERVDAVLEVGDRLVPIDAKFPLEACQRMLAAEGAEAERARREFRRSLKARIDEIADKYIRPDEGTFDFALMYVPAENVYYEAVVRGEDHGDAESVAAYALSRRVIPVSPNTFYAYLAAVLHGLKGLAVEASAREILASLGGLQQQVAKFDEAFALAGLHLERSLRQYGEAEKQLGRIQDHLERLTAAEGGPADPSAVVEARVDEVHGE